MLILLRIIQPGKKLNGFMFFSGMLNRYEIKLLDLEELQSLV